MRWKQDDKVYIILPEQTVKAIKALLDKVEDEEYMIYADNRRELVNDLVVGIKDNLRENYPNG